MPLLFRRVYALIAQSAERVLGKDIRAVPTKFKE
jgi:hypothetical protein